MANWRDLTESRLNTWVQKNRLGIITDVDGTLSPIVNQPDQAVVTPRIKEILTALVPQLKLVAAVSGRAAEDIHERVGVDGMVYIGNHGMERWQDGEVVTTEAIRKYLGSVENAYELLEERAKNFPGVWVEDKTVTLSVHYRNAENREAIVDTLRDMVQAISDSHSLRFSSGRMVFEVRPPVDVNKGTAFRTLVKEFDLDAAIFLGDDVTDVDAIIAAKDLREDRQCHAYGLGVASPETPDVVIQESDFTADGVEGVESFLSWVLMARKASSS
jgi:trehalose 6-phosphate phosphatase